MQIFILIDALGWKYGSDCGFLQDCLHWRTPLRTVLGFSSGAIPTILTGQMPVQHGQWNLFYYDPAGSPFRWLRGFSFLPDSVLNHRVTRKVVKELGRRVLNAGPLFECHISPRLLPWFNCVEKKNIYAAGGIPGTPSIFDHLARTGVPHRIYSYYSGSDLELLERARHDVASSDARFYFLYLSELDAFLHMHCQDVEKTKEKLRWYERELRSLYELAQSVDPSAGFTVFSDHGMTPVRNYVDLAAKVDGLGFSMPSDYLAAYDSTMARFWFFNDRAEREVGAVVRELNCGHVLSHDELEQLGIAFPDRRYGHLIVLLDPTWLVAASNFNGARWKPLGMHGYHPDDPFSDGLFLSNRQPSFSIHGIQDMYRCMREAAV